MFCCKGSAVLIMIGAKLLLIDFFNINFHFFFWKDDNYLKKSKALVNKILYRNTGKQLTFDKLCILRGWVTLIFESVLSAI